MANETNTPILPKFKDRVMFISKQKSSTSIATSYPVSGSFKGIVRLSPNNYNSIYQNNNAQLSSLSDVNSASYSDAIVFDSDVTSQLDWDINYRMIIGSDSDGYLLNFRFSKNAIEFDNLNVIGIFETNDLKIHSYNFTTDDNGQPHVAPAKSLIINNTIMPCNANLNVPTIGNDNSVKDTISVTGKGDNSCLLYSMPTQDNKRQFKYKRSVELIRQVIMQSLLDLETVPTGSIHWFSVSLEQYEKLRKADAPTDKEGEYIYQHNKHVVTDNNGSVVTDDNGNEINVDPIIRDYLLCDGSEYRCTDFPELAKILNKEKIWVKQCKQSGTEQYEINLDSENNDKNEDKKFRVPDLRDLFISYVNATGIMNDSQTIENTNSQFNQTGHYTPDNMPHSKRGEKEDKHFHFIAYGTYGWDSVSHQVISDKRKYVQYPFFSKEQFKTYENTDKNIGFFTAKSTDIDAENVKIYTINANDTKHKITPSVWYLTNHPGVRQSERNGCHWGFGRANHGGCQDPNSCEASGSTCFISAPASIDKIKVYNCEPTLGMSSNPFIISMKTNDTKVWKSSIDDLEEPVENDEIGSEATPKFYAFVPLIRI